MAKIELSSAERKVHRASAHHLDPVVLIGAGGLTAAVRQEVDAALNAHGLVKIRVFSDDRDQRQSMLGELADNLGAAPIQHIGKLLVLWRPQPEPERVVDEERRPGPKTVKVIKYSKRGGQRPQVRRMRVLGNERMTAGGQIKKARRTQKSIKKGRAQ